jgi:hypothetical protein
MWSGNTDPADIFLIRGARIFSVECLQITGYPAIPLFIKKNLTRVYRVKNKSNFQ